MITFKEASNVINTDWKFSSHWENRAIKQGVEWQEIALDDCKNRIYILEKELSDLKYAERELKNSIYATP